MKLKLTIPLTAFFLILAVMTQIHLDNSHNYETARNYAAAHLGGILTYLGFQVVLYVRKPKLRG